MGTLQKEGHKTSSYLMLTNVACKHTQGFLEKNIMKVLPNRYFQYKQLYKGDVDVVNIVKDLVIINFSYG